MTVTSSASDSVEPVEKITCSIDGIEVNVPKGTLIIRAAEQIGIEIPRFCDHPLLSPVAACRMCLVEIEGQPKPQPACAIPVADNMVVKTQLTSEVADKAQQGVMEFLLVNHPLDCPVCDKGGECPLQNQAMTHGRGESRYHGVKRTFPKPINVSAQILLDRERCVSCTRCTRFAEEIAGDPFIDMLDRGASQQVGIAHDRPFDSYFSGNTVQICPVGALTSSDYRFRARPFDLVSTPTACEHCASGCALRTDERRNKVMRRLAWDDPEVNEDWNCDKGRFAFRYLDEDRLTHPLIRVDGEGLVVASWPEALDFAARKLAEARGRTGVLVGGRATREDAYAYAKFSRVALGGDDIDFRARLTSDEEAELLRTVVAGSGVGITYADLERAPVVLFVGLEPEEESPIIFLRMRKAVRAGTSTVAAIAPWASPGFVKAGGVVLSAVPGGEAQVLEALASQDPNLSEEAANIAQALTQPGAIVLAGERLASQPGGFSAAIQLASQTGAAFAWVPRRSGERGALDAGALAGVLPGGRSLTDPTARDVLAELWGVDADDLPAERGLTMAEIIDVLTTVPETIDVVDEQVDVAQDGADGDAVVEQVSETVEEAPSRISGLVVAGLEISDWPQPDQLRLALSEADFVISLETRVSEVAGRYADVVFPVAVDTERAGSYQDWEGRIRSFPQVMKDSTFQTDGKVLAMIADQMDSPIGTGKPADLRRELDAIGNSPTTDGFVPVSAPVPNVPAANTGTAVLATWRHLIDLSLMAAGEEYLAATARPACVRLSAATAAGIGAEDGGDVTVSNDSGSITLPLVITDMPDGVVWIPTNSVGSRLYADLAVGAGAVVSIAQGGSS